jgi:hypothetical protein
MTIQNDHHSDYDPRSSGAVWRGHSCAFGLRVDLSPLTCLTCRAEQVFAECPPKADIAPYDDLNADYEYETAQVLGVY